MNTTEFSRGLLLELARLNHSSGTVPPRSAKTPHQVHIDFPEEMPMPVEQAAEMLLGGARKIVEGEIRFVSGLRLPSGTEGSLETFKGVEVRVLRIPINSVHEVPHIRADILFEAMR